MYSQKCLWNKRHHKSALLHKNKLTVLLLCVVFVFLCQIPAESATYYINGTSGNDNWSGICVHVQENGCGPWKTLQKANTTLSPGDTVYLMSGTYEETIQPNRSGTEANLITYANYADDIVVITKVSNAVDLRQRSYIVVDGLRLINPTGNAGWVNLRENSTHNVIKNCYMEAIADRWAGIYIEEGSHYNKIINNTLVGKCGFDDLIYIKKNATYNLVQGNRLEGGAHASIELQGRDGPVHHNIIRQNYIRNIYHTGINVYTNANWTLIEQNTIEDSGSICGEQDCLENTCGSSGDRAMPRDRHPGIQVGTQNSIFRNNIVTNSGVAMQLESYIGYGEPTTTNNRIYHNTFYANYWGIFINCSGPVYENYFLNNIIRNQKVREIRSTIGSSPKNNYYRRNDVLGATIQYDPDGQVDLAFLETNYPALFQKNLSVNPKFVNEETGDLKLQASSPLVDKGEFLTVTATAGTGTKIFVEDAAYFLDGWGLIPGDKIRLEGRETTQQVLAVDYNTNVITVSQKITWNSGQGIGLNHGGLSPDLGATEVIYPPENLTIITQSRRF